MTLMLTIPAFFIVMFVIFLLAIKSENPAKKHVDPQVVGRSVEIVRKKKVEEEC